MPEKKNTFTKIAPGDEKRYPKFREWSQFQPLSVIREVKTFDNEPVFSAVYSVDQFGMRAMPHEKRLQSHVFIAGCSMIFGIGVNDDETVTSYLKELRPDLDVINFAYGGGGVNFLLRSQQDFSLKKTTDAPAGHFYYVFIADHFSRWHAKPAYLQWALPDYSYYAVEKNQVAFKGPLKEQGFYQEFQRLKKLGLEHTYVRLAGAGQRPVQEEVREFLMGVNELKKKYLESFPRGRFTMVFHPFHDTNQDLYEALLNEARIMGIDIKDPTSIFWGMNVPKEKLQFPHDQHPTPFANKHFARWFADELKRDDQNLK